MNRNFTPKYSDLLVDSLSNDSLTKAPTANALRTGLSNVEYEIGGKLDNITEAAKTASSESEFVTALFDILRNSSYITK